jgi:catechol 2,3-dioxygenase-like lactoylglutathione lyase family enzyme
VSAPGLRHVTLSTATFERSLAFYDAALGALGMARVQEFGDEEEDDAPLEAAGYGLPGQPPVFWLVAGVEVSRGTHVAFGAGSRAQVDAFFAAATRAGGAATQAPRPWEIYRPGYYGALVADPDGNLVEALVGE